MITHDKVGADEDLAREVLIIARDIAPCLDSFPDESEQQKDALAILRRVYKDITARGSRFIKGQSIGPARVEYTDLGSAFDGQPRRALRALCGSAASAGAPVGSFPTERPIARLWPERY
ncbi:hypothetical protein [Microbacterium stercoris]|uniref:Uncharacterized protein n=1 Tax=Microbacterium stercoris TaxID=2820289 RepID=A0A939QN61_9MICO|nr:hypothetical protein [Microbacterium stercoris]MBO3663730.1 hypothetical protein [Microbacterium stercoris]